MFAAFNGNLLRVLLTLSTAFCFLSPPVPVFALVRADCLDGVPRCHLTTLFTKPGDSDALDGGRIWYSWSRSSISLSTISDDIGIVGVHVIVPFVCMWDLWGKPVHWHKVVWGMDAMNVWRVILFRCITAFQIRKGTDNTYHDQMVCAMCFINWSILKCYHPAIQLE